MKKLVFLCVALLVAPVMADVAFEGSCDNGEPCIVTIGYTSTDAPRGVALKLTCTGTVQILGYVADSADEAYNCFIDYAYSTDPYAIGDGHPLADPAGPGVATLPATEVSVCMGVLDQDGNQAAGPASTAKLLQLQVSGIGTIEMTADTLRGPASGVVGSEIPSNLPDVVVIDVSCGEIDPCLAALSAPGYEKQLADYNTYKANGADPSCWCNPYQCVGDANNDTEGLLTKYRVYTNDLNRLLANWKKKIDTADPCADVAHDSEGLLTKYRVYTNDLNLILANWKAKDGDLGIPGPCPKTDADMGL